MSLVSIILLGVATLLIAAVTLAELLPNSAVGDLVRNFSSRSPKSISELEGRTSLTVDELALVEKHVPGLISVVVLCHRVDQPNRSLAMAVLDNFQQGARYSFFVSPEEGQASDLKQYHDWFEHLYHSSAGMAPIQGENSRIRNVTFSELFQINILPMSWSNVPYVFYSFRNNSGTAAIAFKGTQPGVGISDIYDRVSPTEAQAIMDLCSAASRAFDPAIGDHNPDLGVAIPSEPVVIPFGARRQQ